MCLFGVLQWHCQCFQCQAPEKSHTLHLSPVSFHHLLRSKPIFASVRRCSSCPQGHRGAGSPCQRSWGEGGVSTVDMSPVHGGATQRDKHHPHSHLRAIRAASQPSVHVFGLSRRRNMQTPYSKPCVCTATALTAAPQSVLQGSPTESPLHIASLLVTDFSSASLTPTRRCRFLVIYTTSVRCS